MNKPIPSSISLMCKCEKMPCGNAVKQFYYSTKHVKPKTQKEMSSNVNHILSCASIHGVGSAQVQEGGLSPEW